MDVPFRQALFQLAEEQTGNLADVRFLQGMEHNQLIHPVDKLRPEQLLDLLHDGFLHGLVAAHVGHASAAKAQGAARINGMRTGVAGHDDDGILEADHPARVVREASILQNLQEDVEHIRVRLFHLVQEHHAVRLAAHCLGKLAAFLISHVARGGAHQAGGGVFLHVLGHIHTDYAVLVPKHGLPQGAAQFRFTHARGPQEDEGANGPLGVLQSRPCPADGPAYGADRLILANHPLMEHLLQMQQAVRLALGHLLHGNTRPAGHNLRDVVLGHHVLGRALGLLPGRALFLDFLEQRALLVP